MTRTGVAFARATVLSISLKMMEAGMRFLIGLILIFAVGFVFADTKFTDTWFHPGLTGPNEDRLELDSDAPPSESEEAEALQDETIRVTLLRLPELRQGRKLWATTDDYFYCYEPENELVSVPAGFVSDMASIPAAARILYDPADFAEAAFVHDYLYALGEPGGREKADDILRSMIVEGNDSARRAFVVHAAVRAFGNGGYGLPEDYVFYDFSERRLLKALPRPRSGFASVSNCAEALK